MHSARLIAFYLPQFHPIPENDQWWGAGFTEWTNVAMAKPMFRGHYQPRLPGSLGFYDLRVPETRAAQAQLAGDHGIEGFCYWHYWFAGKRLLERPFQEVLRSGQPRLPFCLAWANDSWTGIWHGASGRLLIEQTYPGVDDYVSHFYSLAEAFADERYIKVDGKPLFVVFRPYELPDSNLFIDTWRGLASKEGLGDIYFVGDLWRGWAFQGSGFDAYLNHNPAAIVTKMQQHFVKWIQYDHVTRVLRRVFRAQDISHFRQKRLSYPRIYPYRDYVLHATSENLDRYAVPSVVPNWDNTPRSGKRGLVLHESTPDLFAELLRHAVNQIKDRPADRRLVFLKSWNEWAEGNHLEPDQRFGDAYLEATKKVLVGE